MYLGKHFLEALGLTMYSENGYGYPSGSRRIRASTGMELVSIDVPRQRVSLVQGGD